MGKFTPLFLFTNNSILIRIMILSLKALIIWVADEHL